MSRRAFYQAINLIKSYLEEDTDINTITHGEIETIDTNKKNIFPLAHINILTSPSPENGEILFNFQVSVLDQRNTSKEVITDKFVGNNNELDNLNTTFSVLNTFVLKLKNRINPDDIALVSSSDFEPILANYNNLLDGWSTTVQLSIPNNQISVC